MAAGIDSLVATQLAQDLEDETGIALPATLVFQFNTARAIALHLHRKLVPASRLHRPPRGLGHATGRRSRALVAGTAAHWPSAASSDRNLSLLSAAAFDAGEPPLPDKDSPSLLLLQERKRLPSQIKTARLSFSYQKGKGFSPR